MITFSASSKSLLGPESTNRLDSGVIQHLVEFLPLSKLKVLRRTNSTWKGIIDTNPRWIAFRQAAQVREELCLSLINQLIDASTKKAKVQWLSDNDLMRDNFPDSYKAQIDRRATVLASLNSFGTNQSILKKACELLRSNKALNEHSYYAIKHYLTNLFATPSLFSNCVYVATILTGAVLFAAALALSVYLTFSVIPLTCALRTFLFIPDTWGNTIFTTAEITFLLYLTYLICYSILFESVGKFSYLLIYLKGKPANTNY